MAEKTAYYDLTVFDEEQSTLTFKEWRQAVAGKGVAADGSDFSDMQKIDALLFELASSIENGIQGMQNYTNDAITRLREETKGILLDNEDDITLGGENGKPIHFNDGVEISTIENGIITISGTHTNYIKIKNYWLQVNEDNNHLQLVYNQETQGGDI